MFIVFGTLGSCNHGGSSLRHLIIWAGVPCTYARRLVDPGIIFHITSQRKYPRPPESGARMFPSMTIGRKNLQVLLDLHKK